GAAGADSFQFEACGEIDGVLVCGRAVVTVNIDEPAPTPVITAGDQNLETPADTSLTVTLTSGVVDPNTGEPVGPAYSQSTNIPSYIAGNVADSDGDEQGDNKSGFSMRTMGPALDSTGGAGLNGTVRTHVEFALSTITNPNIQSALVTLAADPAGDETLDASFYPVQADGNGSLDNSDFQAAVGPTPVAVMPSNIAPGKFTFDVTSQVQGAMDSGWAHFSLQGRVDETSTCEEGPCNGPRMRSGSTLNNQYPCDGLSFGPCVPTLEVTSSAYQVTFSIASPPANGTLKDSDG
ncbi:MAG: hypothetical protein GY859_42130, partial [Desulfobacterales bacterium]|nr:hypothetical protein [Desulfobacterales bacterium]